MKRSGMVYATNPDRHLVAITDENGFTILNLDDGPADVGDTLTSDDEGKLWFNTTRSVRIIAYPKSRGVRPNDLRRQLYPNG